jgi:hypothetical protein
MRNRASLSAAEGLRAELLYMAATYEHIAEAAPDSQAPGPKS